MDSPSPRANESLVLLAEDVALANRLLRVRIYQVFHTTPEGKAECVGFRVAATDDVENDYALFVHRAKSEQLFHAVASPAEAEEKSPNPSGEAVARSILAHLEIAGNRHRDVGRLVCRDPDVHVDHKPRVVPRPKSSSKTRNAHLPTKEHDKRASRNKQSQQRAMQAIAAAHAAPSHAPNEDADAHEPTVDPVLKADEDARKSRKISEASLLHRLAHTTHAAVYRTDLGSIDDDQTDDMEEQEEDEEVGEATSQATIVSSAPTYKRVLPDRKPKYSALQQRRDKERKQRQLVVRRPVSSPNALPQSEVSPPKPLAAHDKAASTSPTPSRTLPFTSSPSVHSTRATGSPLNEQEQFLRRRTILENHNRVFKSEGVFDDAMGVEITHERPDHRFHTPEHAPPSPDPAIQKRKASSGRRRSSTTHQKKSTTTSDDAARRSLAGSASAPVLLSPRDLDKLSPRPEEPLSESTSNHETVADVFVVPDEHPSETNDGSIIEAKHDKQFEQPAPDRPSSESREIPDDDAELDSINLAHDVVVERWHDEQMSTQAVDNPDPVEDEIAESVRPNTTHLPPVIHIHEEDPGDDEPSRQETERASLEPEVADEVSSHEEPFSAERILEPFVSPRVECWEEVESPTRGDIVDPEVAVADSVKASDPAGSDEQQWAKPTEPAHEEQRQDDQAPEPDESQVDSEEPETDTPAVEAEVHCEPVSIEESVVSQHMQEPIEDPTVEVERAPSTRSVKEQEDLEEKTALVDDVAPVFNFEPAASGLPSRADVNFTPSSVDRTASANTAMPVRVSSASSPAQSTASASAMAVRSSSATPSMERTASCVATPVRSASEDLPMERAANGVGSLVDASSAVTSVEGPTSEVVVSPVRVPTKSPTLVRTASTAAISRRGSLLDAATAAIACAAAAAAVTAAAVPVAETPQATLKTSPKSESRRKQHKRRSHDATPVFAALGNHGDNKRLGPRRSTIHLLHSAEKSKNAAVTPAAVAPLPTDKGELSTTMSSPPKPHDEDHEPTVHTPSSSTASVASEADRKPLHPTPHHHHRQRSQQEIDALLKSPTYHTKWLKWSNGKQLIDKVSCLQLEEQLLRDPSDASNLLKLGLRYARWPATSLPAVLLLENAAVVQAGEAGHSHEYWNSLGNAHFDVFLRHRKFLPVATFHLSKGLQAFTRAFAYLESVADPLLLLRYAICMYWKKSDGNANLEHADDIFRELFAKFASFCDKDRPSLLFLHFQILCRLKMFNEAIDCLAKIVAIHETTVTSNAISTADAASHQGNAPLPYDSGDYLLMLMHCQQASGDFLQASVTFAQLLKRLHQLNSDILPDGSTLGDQDYLQMWCGLADKCFHHEDYALAIEFYSITVTYAKDSRVLARVLYNHALCYQAIGEGIKCSAEFKRAKNINRHVVPFATLAEIHARYDDQYATVLRTPIDKIIEDVRLNLYDRAVTSLQRIFRRKKKSESGAASGSVDGVPHLERSSSGGIRNANGRRQSVVATLTNLVEGSGNRRSSGISAGTVPGSVVDGAIDPHEAFLKRQAAALEALQELRKGRQLKKSSSVRVASTKLGLGTKSGLLSPVDDRPDLRRKHSMDSLAKRLGYLPENREQFAGYWYNTVTTSLDLYETETEFNLLIARIRSILPLVSEAVVCCALADALGSVDDALERLHDTDYEQELQLVSTVVDVTSIMRRHFANPNEKSDRTRFPPIHSPVKTSLSASTKQEPSPSARQAPLTHLPPCKSPSVSNIKAVRVSSLIDAQFEQASRGVKTDENSGSQRLRDTDKFVVVDDFRAVNTSLLHGWQR